MEVEPRPAYSVLLVNAPNPVDGNTSGNYAVFPALGIITLGTQLQKNFAEDINVKVIDGGVHSKEEIKAVIGQERPELVGISVLTPTYGEGLDIARYAKSQDAVTVLGADHACFFPGEILRRRSYVDYVVQAEGGEASLTYLVGQALKKNKELSIVQTGPEKIFGRKGGQVIEVASFPEFTIKGTYQAEDDIPDLRLVGDDLETLARNYNRRYGAFHESQRRPAVLNNVRGCGNGTKKKRCTYCSIWDLQLNEGNIGFFWKTVQQYNEKHGINFFFEVSDSFLSFQRYVRKLVEVRPFDPRERGIELEVYARANDIVNMKDGVALLQALNVTRVDLGLDSGDDTMLQYLRKNNKDKSGKIQSPSRLNYEAVRKLTEAGITIHASFPLGSLGETRSSLENTLRFIERLALDFPNRLATLEASELVPLPHSPSWDLLTTAPIPMFDFQVDGGLKGMLEQAGIRLPLRVQEHLQEKYVGEDHLDVEELAKDWIRYFTQVAWEDIEQAKRRVNRLASRIGAAYGRSI